MVSSYIVFLEEILLIESFDSITLKLMCKFTTNLYHLQFQSSSKLVSPFLNVFSSMQWSFMHVITRKEKKDQNKSWRRLKKIVYLEYEYAKVNPSASGVQRMQNDAKRSCQVMCTARHKWQAIRHFEGLFKIRRWIFQRFVLNRNDLIFIRMGEKDTFWKGLQWFVSRDVRDVE